MSISTEKSARLVLCRFYVSFDRLFISCWRKYSYQLFTGFMIKSLSNYVNIIKSFSEKWVWIFVVVVF